MSDGVPVRGTCKKGHTLSTVAPKGRVTWRGPCPEAGCDGSIIAKRIATNARTDPPAAPPAPKARSFRVVKGYRDEPKPEFDQPAPDDRGPGGPSGLPEDPPDVDDEPGSPPRGSDDDGPGDGEPPRRGRLLRRRPGGPRVAPPGLGDDYRVIPGVY